MKETELMIGDLFKKRDTQGTSLVKVTGIQVSDHQEMKYYIEVDDGQLEQLLRVYELEPIPLTQEMLERNGFIKCGHLLMRGFKNEAYRFSFFLEYNPDNLCLFINDGLLPRAIRYVHEFQHVWRLCGVLEEFQI